MKLTISRNTSEKALLVPSSLFTLSNLVKESALEFTAAEKVLVATPAFMTAMEMIQCIDSLHTMATELMMKLSEACGECKDCDLCKAESLEDTIHLPPQLLTAAGLPPDCKLDAYVDDGDIIIKKADYTYDLADVPEYLLESMALIGMCLSELKDKLIQDDVVYMSRWIPDEEKTRVSRQSSTCKN